MSDLCCSWTAFPGDSCAQCSGDAMLSLPSAPHMLSTSCLCRRCPLRWRKSPQEPGASPPGSPLREGWLPSCPAAPLPSCRLDPCRCSSPKQALFEVSLLSEERSGTELLPSTELGSRVHLQHRDLLLSVSLPCLAPQNTLRPTGGYTCGPRLRAAGRGQLLWLLPPPVSIGDGHSDLVPCTRVSSTLLLEAGCFLRSSALETPFLMCLGGRGTERKRGEVTGCLCCSGIFPEPWEKCFSWMQGFSGQGNAVLL